MSTTNAPKNVSSMLDTHAPRAHAPLLCDECSALMGWDAGPDMVRQALAELSRHECPWSYIKSMSVCR